MAFEVKLTGISHTYKVLPLFENLNCLIGAGEQLYITGLSGTGKTTLLEIAGGVIPPKKGSVVWDGIEVFSCSRVDTVALELRSAIVFQQHALISYLPLFENVALPLRHHRKGTKEEIDSRVEVVLERFNINTRSWRLPEELSVGERRLGSIARALVVEPDLLCMDEPTEGLDDLQKELFISVFKELCEKKKTTVVIASDDQKVLDLALHGNVINLNSSGDGNENQTE